MSRYFFDTNDGSFDHSDEDGQDLADPDAARQLALRCLSDMAQDHLAARSDRQRFTVVVRDAARMPIYTAELSLDAQWLEAGVGMAEQRQAQGTGADAQD